MYKIIYHPVINTAWRVPIKFLCPWLKKRSILPVSGILTFKSSNGTPFKLISNPTSYTMRRVYWDGLDAFEYMYFFQRMIKQFDFYFDIGANSGLYTITAKANNSRIIVHSFEPSPGPYRVLKKNVELNSFSNINIHKIALSDEDGEAAFFATINHKYPFIADNLGGVGNLKHQNETRSMEKVKVQAIRLDNFIEKYNIKGSVFIKMDTEATEDMILRGMSEFIDENRPVFVCETLFHMIENKLEAIMLKHNYLFYNWQGAKPQLIPSLLRTSDNNVRDCFFVPAEKKDFFDTLIDEIYGSKER